jgi:PilZ domain
MDTKSNGPTETPRCAARVPVTSEVTIRRSGLHGFRVRAFDLSPEGCKVEFVERPVLGERVWIKFGGLEALEAQVRWIDGHVGGVQFARPLYPSIFERIAL